MDIRFGTARYSLLFLAFATIGFSTTTRSQDSVLPLWKTVPGALEDITYKEEPTFNDQGTLTGINNVSVPDLTVFLADERNANGTAVVICPGGGYRHLAMDKEGYKVAKWLNSLGISAFVLKYRMPSDQTMENKSIGPLQDAQEAIRTVRRNATKWNLDVHKIGVMGFSAGGHLASTVSTHYDEKVYRATDTISARPDFSILLYPVISMEEGITHKGSKTALLGESPEREMIDAYSNEKRVNAETPVTFLVHSTDDGVVPVENSLNYYTALKRHQVPVEMHIYEDGGHGFGLGVSGTHTNWPQACEQWLMARGLISKERTAFLFSYFKGNGEDGLHLAYSTDGYHWEPLRNDTSFLVPRVGKDKLMRDPCIIRGGDGNYHMVWTVSWTDKGIGYASSKNLIDWTPQQFIPVMAEEGGTRNAWAPEITYDEKNDQYMIYWASTVTGKFPETASREENGYNHRMYYTTTRDFKTYGPTKLLYEPGFNVIDASIRAEGGEFIMFLKDETRTPPQKNIKIAHSDVLTGPYGKASAPITGKYWAEGPTALKLDGSWVVYFDKYTDKQYGAVRQAPSGWTDISDKVHFPKGARHGSVFEVPLAVLERLKKL
ncbi:MAG: prolyl oligopeptidase family serine peptidase [Sediminicola sp.]